MTELTEQEIRQHLPGYESEIWRIIDISRQNARARDWSRPDDPRATVAGPITADVVRAVMRGEEAHIPGFGYLGGCSRVEDRIAVLRLLHIAGVNATGWNDDDRLRGVGTTSTLILNALVAQVSPNEMLGHPADTNGRGSIGPNGATAAQRQFLEGRIAEFTRSLAGRGATQRALEAGVDANTIEQIVTGQPVTELGGRRLVGRDQRIRAIMMLTEIRERRADYPDTLRQLRDTAIPFGEDRREGPQAGTLEHTFQREFNVIIERGRRQAQGGLPNLSAVGRQLSEQVVFSGGSPTGSIGGSPLEDNSGSRLNSGTSGPSNDSQRLG